MEFREFLIKYAEIGIKGKNRFIFEDMLVMRIKQALAGISLPGASHPAGNFDVQKENGRIYATVSGEYDYDEIVRTLQYVFGISAICPMVHIEDRGFDDLKEQAAKYMLEMYGNKNRGEVTFKVNARRARKNYPLNSMEINAGVGEKVLETFKEARVDVHNPDVYLNIEIRKHINIYSLSIPGPGGMPVGTGGKAMVLLSGGIDSPAAAYMIARRGVEIEAVYFHTPPYTSERAKNKVIELAKKLSPYTGAIRLHVVNFTEIQLHIYDMCPHEELTIIMKRCMYKIAQQLARQNGCMGLITGESIGQVSSQTLQSLAVIDNVADMPVYRPLIAFDKQDIVAIAEKIDTYGISVQPYEDCCTTFVAKHPVTKPTLRSIEKSEGKLENIDNLINEAISSASVTIVPEPEPV